MADSYTRGHVKYKKKQKNNWLIFSYFPPSLTFSSSTCLLRYTTIELVVLPSSVRIAFFLSHRIRTTTTTGRAFGSDSTTTTSPLAKPT
ncbi:hypothetical protein BDZ91DRAFT_718782 [Kalaharituber pfeilii]|nr:hypothetical protein BDZ91DRAFT_718782 [Kalaharituber pfeilii]